MLTERKQTTIAKSVQFQGIGLHTGHTISMLVKPALADAGVYFVRSDVPGHPRVPADVSCVIGTARGTTVAKGDVKIHTVEHLLAALRGVGLDNVEIEIDGDEIPAMDGSSLPFCEALKAVGVTELEKMWQPFILKSPVHVMDKDMCIMAVPADELRISFTIDYGHQFLRPQHVSYTFNPQTFVRDIAPARTFCFDYEIEMLRKQNLIKGGSLDNAVVISDNKVLNQSLRFEDECVRHKILDFIGDLSLLGCALKAHVVAVKSGHSLNIKFVRHLRALMGKKEVTVDHKPTDQGLLDINEIQRTIPHRYPFLLIDRILSIEEDHRIVGLKNVTINEPFFNGHFPGHPVMPGVLIVEALAQTAAVLMLRKLENNDKIAYFMSVDQTKFRKPVVPGDQLVLHAELIKVRSRVGVFKGLAYVAGDLVAEGEFKFSLVDK